jgi:prolyl-tRNA synthetase
MRQSQLLGKTRKEEIKDELSVNAQLLTRAGFIDKLMAGVYSYLPLGQKVMSKIENIVREELLAIDSQEILMPAMHTSEIWEKTGRWDSLDILFKLKSRHHEREYALGPTHEEVVTPLVQNFVESYKDLPVSVFQIQTKFRDEPRARSGLLRGREFRMKDMYSFHQSQADLDSYYEVATEAYRRMFQRLGLGEVTYLTYASGGSFSKYSHEFQSIAASGEDTIYACHEKKIAVNREIFEEVQSTDDFRGLEFTEERSIEVGNIFKLGTRFSEAFGMDYTLTSGERRPVIMGCYGFGPSRVMGAIVEIHHDRKGIIWPKSVAPYQVHLIPLGKDEHVSAEGERLYASLRSLGIEVLYDNRDVSAGVKLNDCDLIGIPLRVVISNKSLGQGSLEVKMRNNSSTRLIQIEGLHGYILDEGKVKV